MTGITAFAAEHPGCDFCKIDSMDLFGFEVSAFQRLPFTSNFFSSVVLDQSEHFTLKITRGAFVPFYFLIISKEHYVRTADLPPEKMADLKKFKAKVETFYLDVLQTPFVVFEHGSSAEGGGGCVDHLHLHILPFSGEIENSADLNLPTRFAPYVTLKDFSELTGPNVGSQYIFYQNPRGQLHLYNIIDHTPSQLLRLLIAESLGIGEEFNWREFANRGDFWANAAQSLAGYSTWIRTDAANARSKIKQKKWDERVTGMTEIHTCFTLL